VTYDGEIGEFRGGIMKALQRNPVPVVPMAVSGLWQSLFSHNRERLWHIARLFPRLRLVVGEPVAPDAVTPELLRARVLALRGDWK
jgi:1-acyl-sn-glycerol-3-phosphate acyltransferase